jgi:putative ABC transport system permease protein
LNAIVLIEAVLVMLIAFVPAFAAAIGIYAVVRSQTLLPVNMTGIELGGVLAATLLMSVISALLSLGRLRRADPAEIF